MDEYNSVSEIDERINFLRNNSNVWSQAGIASEKMLKDVDEEINDLELQKNDLINGTYNYQKVKTIREIKGLKSFRETVSLLKKVKSNEQNNQKNKIR